MESNNNGETLQQYEEAWDKVKRAHGIVVPGGFGDRGFLGKVLTAEYCRVNSKPYLGICLGFQAMVVEYSRNILQWDDAHSTELDENTTHPVVMFMPEVDPTTMGGTMRLGARDTIFMSNSSSSSSNGTSNGMTNGEESPKSVADGNIITNGVHPHTPNTMKCSSKHADFKSQLKVLYGNKTRISERHRHRYEVNPQYVTQLEEAGLVFCGRDTTGERMEIVELPASVHPYYVGTQFHPEFKSRPLNPSPPFVGLIQKAKAHSNN